MIDLITPPQPPAVAAGGLNQLANLRLIVQTEGASQGIPRQVTHEYLAELVARVRLLILEQRHELAEIAEGPAIRKLAGAVEGRRRRAVPGGFASNLLAEMIEVAPESLCRERGKTALPSDQRGSEEVDDADRGLDYRDFPFSNARGLTVAGLDDYLKNGTAGVGNNRTRLPGFPAGRGDGGPKVQSPEIEVTKLNPVDTLPPITVITHVRKDAGVLIVRGTTTDNGGLRRVTVNGNEAKVAENGEWEMTLAEVMTGQLKLTAGAADTAGNSEKTPHGVTVVVR